MSRFIYNHLSAHQMTPSAALGDPLTGKDATPNQVFLVGSRYLHHAQHSGYEGFRRYITQLTHLMPLVKARYLKFAPNPSLAWRVDVAVAKLTKRKFFSVFLLLTEAGTAVHMLRRRGALYHVLYGDTDVWMLGHVGKITGNHVIASFHEPTKELESLVSVKLARSLDAVVLVSESQRSYFEDKLPADRIFVVPLGVDTDFFRRAPKPSSTPTCITVGSHWRDFNTLGAAVDLVLAQRPDIRFVAIGTSGEKGGPAFRHSRVEQLSGISDEEFRSRYQSSWVGMFCFNEVTANLALLECLSCGVPVVATDTGGIREYTSSGCSILCPPKDARAIAEGVLKVINDASGAAAWRASARQHALQFDYRINAQKMSRVYSQVALRGHRYTGGFA